MKLPSVEFGAYFFYKKSCSLPLSILRRFLISPYHAIKRITLDSTVHVTASQHVIDSGSLKPQASDAPRSTTSSRLFTKRGGMGEVL